MEVLFVGSVCRLVLTRWFLLLGLGYVDVQLLIGACIVLLIVKTRLNSS